MNNDNIPKPRGYHHGNLRAALIGGALRAIAEDGPDGFTLRDVARRVGVSAAAPYRHFRDKDELMAAVASECAARLAAAMTEAVMAAPPDPLAQFRATGIAYVRFAVAHPEHFRALTVPGLLAQAPAEQRAQMDAWGAEQRRELVAAQDAGLIAKIPLEELMLAANALVHGLAHLIVEGQLGPVDAERATQLAIAATGALGTGFIPRPEGIPPDELRAPRRATPRNKKQGTRNKER